MRVALNARGGKASDNFVRLNLSGDGFRDHLLQQKEKKLFHGNAILTKKFLKSRKERQSAGVSTLSGHLKSIGDLGASFAPESGVRLTESLNDRVSGASFPISVRSPGTE